MRGILHYNEAKIAAGKAELILAQGFATDIERLGFSEKLRRFQKLTDLRPALKSHALHISLNFPPNEKLTHANLQVVAQKYMDELGFGEQPFLVYRHHDAAHDHLHIATVSITREGKAIPLHNIGRGRSEVARRKVEKAFGLQAAEKRDQTPPRDLPLVPAAYGRIPTKQAMNNILTRVMREYAFVSLAEWSAILQSYHVALIRGESGSRMEQHNGMAYSLTDANGNHMGVPLKASAFYCKPTLETLEKKMRINAERQKPDTGATRKIAVSLLNTSGINELAAFKKALEGKQISLILHHNSDGYLYGVHYVNHRERTVFKGSELGKTMGAAGLRERFAVRKALLPEKQQRSTVSLPVSGNATDNEKVIRLPENLLAPLLEETFTPGIPLALRRKRKKKGQRI